MRKTDKKLDNQLRAVLTQVCEQALEEIEGFVWLTHVVDYQKLSTSLKVVCVFSSNAQLTSFMQSAAQEKLMSLIANKLTLLGIKLKQAKQQIIFDCEENCQWSHQGNWAQRLSQLH